MKKKIPENISTTMTPELREVVTSNLILPLGLDLGREDLNKLVDKLNEVIKKVNQ